MYFTQRYFQKSIQIMFGYEIQQKNTLQIYPNDLKACHKIIK